MLSIGIDNFIGSAVVTATGSALGRGAELVKTSDITHWQGDQPDCKLTAEITDADLTILPVEAGGVPVEAGGVPVEVGVYFIEIITAHRIKFDGTLTVRGFFVSELVTEKTFTEDDISGIEVYSLFAANGISATKIELEFTGGTVAPSIGYIWIGNKIDFKTTAYQDIDETGDIGSISQGGYAGNSRRPILRSYQVTLAHEESGTIKRKLRRILKSGYTVPRPILRTDECYPDEALLGVLDSNRIGYDMFDNKTADGLKKAQATIGIAEVLGGI